MFIIPRHSPGVGIVCCLYLLTTQGTRSSAAMSFVQFNYHAAAVCCTKRLTAASLLNDVLSRVEYRV